MRLSSHGGFTLVEMVIVISVISIVLAMTYPSLHRSIEKYRFENAAREVVSDIEYTRQKALAESSGDYKIKFDKSYYQIEVKDGINNKAIKRISLPNNVIFHNSYIMSFGANGNPTRGVTIKVQQTELKKAYDIAITPVTGRVELRPTTYQVID